MNAAHTAVVSFLRATARSGTPATRYWTMIRHCDVIACGSLQ